MIVHSFIHSFVILLLHIDEKLSDYCCNTAIVIVHLDVDDEVYFDIICAIICPLGFAVGMRLTCNLVNV